MAFEYRPIHTADLMLSKLEFDALIERVKAKLYREDAHWLAEWEYYDKTHVMMNESERADARVLSYNNWYKKLRESMIHE
jgi:hypothetical protein